MKRAMMLILTACLMLLAALSAFADESEAVRHYLEFDSALASQLGEIGAPTGKEKIGVLVISLTNPFWSNMKSCYESAASRLGITVEVRSGTTEDDANAQLDVLMTMADGDHDLVIVSPIDGTDLIPGIVKCSQNGVKVIDLDPGVDLEALKAAGGRLDGKITVHFEDQGRIAATDMVARMPEGGKVAILQGLPGASQSDGRTSGATEVFRASDKIDLVATLHCNWDATAAYEATKDILTKHPDLKGIFACNDVMALGAVTALEEEDALGVYVYGVDLTDDAREAIRGGRMTGSVSLSSVKYAEAALKMACAVIAGKKYESPIYVPLTLVTIDNVAELDGWR